MAKIEEALSCLTDEGLNCAQAIFCTYARELGLERETAVRIATGFGGGMTRMGETCGMVTGALMAIGLKYGNESDSADNGENEKGENTYRLGRELVEEFRARHGSVRVPGYPRL